MEADIARVLWIAIGSYLVALIIGVILLGRRERARRRASRLAAAAGFAPLHPPPAPNPRRAFEAHRETCPTCRASPLALCPLGRALLTYAVDDQEGTIA